MTSFDHHLLLLRAQPFASTGGFWLNAPGKGARGTYGIHVGPLCELCGSTGRRFIVLNLVCPSMGGRMELRCFYRSPERTNVALQLWAAAMFSNIKATFQVWDT